LENPEPGFLDLKNIKSPKPEVMNKIKEPPNTDLDIAL